MSQDDDLTKQDADRALVGEYVLGTLPEAERAELTRRLKTEPHLLAEKRLWDRHFAALDADFAEHAPPAKIWRGLEKRLFGQTRPGLWDSLALWRSLAGAGVLAACAALGFVVIQPKAINPDEFAARFVAAIQAQEGSGVEFVALYDPDTSKVRVMGVSGQPVSNRDFELWYIKGNEPAVSMGVIPMDEHMQIPLDAQAQQKFHEGTVLAVTLEPKGGSPTGAATGPIVAMGKAQAI
jgi:anti-sigma-K factor RskA